MKSSKVKTHSLIDKFPDPWELGLPKHCYTRMELVLENGTRTKCTPRHVFNVEGGQGVPVWLIIALDLPVQVG